jgi:hypothetical protein
LPADRTRLHLLHELDVVAVGVFDERDAALCGVDGRRFGDDDGVGFLDDALEGRVDVLDGDRQVVDARGVDVAVGVRVVSTPSSVNSRWYSRPRTSS